MLYIEDESRNLWPAVARVLVCLQPLDMVLSLHPGDSFDGPVGPFEPSDGREWLEPVDENEAAATPHSARLAVDEELLTSLEQVTDEFEDWGEALVLYPNGRNEWVAAVIPHEATIHVRDDFGSSLAAAGFRLSDDPPDWR